MGAMVEVGETSRGKYTHELITTKLTVTHGGPIYYFFCLWISLEVLQWTCKTKSIIEWYEWSRGIFVMVLKHYTYISYRSNETNSAQGSKDPNSSMISILRNVHWVKYKL